MDSNKLSMDKNNFNKNNYSSANLEKIKSNYFIAKIYDNIQRKKYLEIIKYNKKIQNRLNLNIKDYKEFSEIYTAIEIEIKSNKNKIWKIY